MIGRNFYMTLALLALGLVFIMTASAEAKTVVVDDDWSGADYNTIPAAVAAANAGDTIRVYEGVYYGSVRVDKTLNIIGNGTSKTYLNGYGTGGQWHLDHQHGFHIAADNCNVSGFMIHGCHPTHEFGGIGIYSKNNRIFDNYFYDNNNGIFLNGPENTIFNNTFDFNLYGIRVDRGGDDCNISFNYFTKTILYSIYYQDSSDSVLYSNTFYNESRGAVILYRVQDISVIYNMFESTSKLMYAMTVWECERISVSNNTFFDNGRGVSIGQSGNVSITNNTFMENVIGVNVASANGPITVNYNIIHTNTEDGVNASLVTGHIIDAEYNWWGDTSGPYHYANNTGGAGDNVTDNVDYDPCLGKSINFPPVAFMHSIEPQLAQEGETVTFFGRGLARNWIDTHVWRSSIDGDLYSGTATKFSRSDLSNGTHTIFLKVRDKYGQWSPEVQATLVVNGRPRAEIVSISPNMTNEGEEVQFQGDFVDHEDDITEFLWISDVDGVIGSLLTFNTSTLSNGTHIITFRVLDGYGVWSENVTGNAIVNGLPRAWIDSIEPSFVNESESVIFRGDFLDHEDDIQVVQWESDIDGLLSDQKLFFTSSLSNGTHTITFRVRDGQGSWSSEVTRTITVNGLPWAIIQGIGPNPAVSGDMVSFEGDYIDHEDDIVEFLWSSDIDGPISSELEFSTSTLSNGTHIITYRICDGHGVWSANVWETIVIDGRPEATIVDIQPPSVNAGEEVDFQGDYFDFENRTEGFSWVSSIDGLLSTSKDFSTTVLSNGTHVITFRVRDTFGTWSENATGTVTVNGLPSASISIEPSSVDEGESVEFIGDYIDFEDDIVEFTWVSNIDGPLSSDMTFTTSDLSNGTHTIYFQVRDHRGVWSDNATGTVLVNGVPHAEIILIQPNPAFEGEAIDITGVGTDDGTIAGYQWTSLKDGELLTFTDTYSFMVSNLSAGVHIISLRVRDDQGTWSQVVTHELVVKENEVRFVVTAIDFTSPVFEKEKVSINAIVRNLSRIPFTNITVVFYIGDETIGSVTLDESLEPFTDVPATVEWVAQLGNHTISVDLVYDGAIILSREADMNLEVNPIPKKEEPSIIYRLSTPPLVYYVITCAVVAVVILVYIFKFRSERLNGG